MEVEKDKNFAEMLAEDIKRVGKVKENGDLVLTGIKDEVKIGCVRTKEEVDKATNDFILRDRPGETIVTLADGTKAIIKQNKLQSFEKKIISFFDKRDLAEQLLRIQPLHFDEAKNWWIWLHDEYKWALTDEVNILNLVNHISSANTINSTEKTEIIEALRQESRKVKPKPIPDTWLQFRDILYDIKTGTKQTANSGYFITNPIPYELNKDSYELTPTLDRIFEEWVGKAHVKTLYEIISFCLLPSYPIHRLFCFIGAGMNGKSCFLRLLEKFIGGGNVCTTELDTLLNSRFEVTRLHKKLVCIMGETNFAELNKTSLIKKLTGGDMIGFEYKNKNPFEDYNYAKILIATNNLPETTDKTIGFYRRWLIIDFPNQFSEETDILASVPEEEYTCLALKCCSILLDLLKDRKFTNEGSVEERMKRYEDKSNPLDKFIKDNIVVDPNEYITKYDFENKFKSWLKENRFREMSEVTIGKSMKERGFEQGRKTINYFDKERGFEMSKQVFVWFGVKWSSYQNTKKVEKVDEVEQSPVRDTHVKLTEGIPTISPISTKMPQNAPESPDFTENQPILVEKITGQLKNDLDERAQFEKKMESFGF